tara:strand:- start:843 stop:1682 length:840 start_codon:yes stop_codon:yes gene_type:complete
MNHIPFDVLYTYLIPYFTCKDIKEFSKIEKYIKQIINKAEYLPTLPCHLRASLVQTHPNSIPPIPSAKHLALKAAIKDSSFHYYLLSEEYIRSRDLPTIPRNGESLFSYDDFADLELSDERMWALLREWRNGINYVDLRMGSYDSSNISALQYITTSTTHGTDNVDSVYYPGRHVILKIFDHPCDDKYDNDRCKEWCYEQKLSQFLDVAEENKELIRYLEDRPTWRPIDPRFDAMRNMSFVDELIADGRLPPPKTSIWKNKKLMSRAMKLAPDIDRYIW